MNTDAKIKLLQPALENLGFCWLELRLCSGQGERQLGFTTALNSKHGYWLH